MFLYTTYQCARGLLAMLFVNSVRQPIEALALYL